MRRREFVAVLGSAAIARHVRLWRRTPERLRRVGVILQGDTYYVGVVGLREGLKALGAEEGSRLALLVRDTKGDLRAAGPAARALECDERVDLIVALATSIALETKRSTETVPIVFVTGSDPSRSA